MKTTIVRVCASLSLVLSSWVASPADATETPWNHRGSLMKLVHTGNEVTIKFLDPKQSLHAQGVQRGTVLFQGTIGEDKTLKGSAFAFKEGCDPISYDATGKYDPKSLLENFEIEGTAPVWPDKGCEVTPAAAGAAPGKLLFTPYGLEEEDVEEAPAVAQAVEASVEPTAAATATAVATASFPREGKSKGGVVRDGPAMKSVALDTLEDGDRITIVEDSGQSMNGYNWYKVRYPGGKGYHWGGLICVDGEALTGVVEVCK